MKEILDDKSEQELEIQTLRKERAKYWRLHLKIENEGAINDLAMEYFLEMSSKDIRITYLSHHIAYLVCQEKAGILIKLQKKLREECEKYEKEN